MLCNPSHFAKRLVLVRSFSSKPTATERVTRPGKAYLRGAALGLAIFTVPLSYYGREWRKEQIQLLDAASKNMESPGYLWYQVNDLILNMKRAGIMGQTAKSVSGELGVIQKWHQEHGYAGGIVLRDLEQPLFLDDMDDIVEDPMRRARRECYYLYYERTPTAEIRQEIFCRGTTLFVDVLTCLQFWYVYDEELDTKVHRGFRNHADRLIEDLIPLLVKDNKRATVSVSGHSLGGAVASIVALKLKKRGYNVTKLTTIASPRFCNREGVSKLSPLLPEKTLRCEDDRDLVHLLPPFAAHLECDKLWFVQDDVPRLVPKAKQPSWVDSVLINFRAWEILTSFSYRHRIESHVDEVEKIE